jgi:hypothetical protein
MLDAVDLIWIGPYCFVRANPPKESRRGFSANIFGTCKGYSHSAKHGNRRGYAVRMRVPGMVFYLHFHVPYGDSNIQRR